MEKEVTRIHKNGEEIPKNISYILQFIASPRFMASSLSNFVNNLSEAIHRIKCIYTIISLSYCCEKVFILKNTWMIGKNSMKHHYLKKKNFMVV